MARHEPRVHTINILKYLKCKEISFFLSREKRDRERERERGREEKKQPFFGDFTGFCRLELNRTRVKAALRDESYTWVLESQDFAKVRVFMETEKMRCPRKSRKLR